MTSRASDNFIKKIMSVIELVLRGCLKIIYFTQFLCCQKNLILKILCVSLRLDSSSALNLNKPNNFQTTSLQHMTVNSL